MLKALSLKGGLCKLVSGQQQSHANLELQGGKKTELLILDLLH